MPSFNEKKTRDAIVQRMEKLTKDSVRKWGKMTPDQMVHHCNRSLEYLHGKFLIPFRGNGFTSSGFFKFMVLGVPLAFPKGKADTFQELLSDGTYNLEKEKSHFIHLVNEYDTIQRWPTSPFMGKMTKDDWGIMTYKHFDHHLRQFGL